MPAQGTGPKAFVFCADAETILQIATIDRATRDESGALRGFQRPQIAEHIDEIRRYFLEDDAVLPNSIVLAFTAGVQFSEDPLHPAVTIDVSAHKGLVVDGQQRLTALKASNRSDFQLVVTALLCRNTDELRKQFILINNTRPLPKPLIYELLPTVDGLPPRLSRRAVAARLVERLNYDPASSLRGQIHQHTNPKGVLKDTSLQRLILNSLSDGALRETAARDLSLDSSVRLISEFFEAVQEVFAEAWAGHTPRSSRLVHGAGVVAMGYVMEYIHAATGATRAHEFVPSLRLLTECTAWTAGHWRFSEGSVRPWNSLQNLQRDWLELSHYLVSVVKRGHRANA